MFSTEGDLYLFELFVYYYKPVNVLSIFISFGKLLVCVCVRVCDLNSRVCNAALLYIHEYIILFFSTDD